VILNEIEREKSTKTSGCNYNFDAQVEQISIKTNKYLSKCRLIST
jgi:hypothetical protein